MNYIAMIIALFTSLIIHEIAHSAAALYCGDKVSKLEKRISFNPANHIDLFGTLVLPLFLFLISSPFLIGYAKPVRINIENFKNKRWGLFLVAIAGPLSNLILAGIFYTIITVYEFKEENFLSQLLLFFFIYNILLALFNLLPFPPLDGSNMMKSILPEPLDTIYIALEPLLIILFFVFLLSGGLGAHIRPLVEFLILRIVSL